MSKIIFPKYCDANSILLVNKVGKMRRLYCPFTVIALVDLTIIKKGAALRVEHVATIGQEKLVYLIFGDYYPYSHFKITASF